MECERTQRAANGEKPREGYFMKPHLFFDSIQLLLGTVAHPPDEHEKAHHRKEKGANAYRVVDTQRRRACANHDVGEGKHRVGRCVAPPEIPP